LQRSKLKFCCFFFMRTYMCTWKLIKRNTQNMRGRRPIRYHQTEQRNWHNPKCFKNWRISFVFKDFPRQATAVEFPEPPRLFVLSEKVPHHCSYVMLSVQTKWTSSFPALSDDSPERAEKTLEIRDQVSVFYFLFYERKIHKPISIRRAYMVQRKGMLII